MSKGTTGIISVIRTPLGILVLFIMILVLAGLTVASSISGELTAAAVSGVGLFVLVILLVVVNALGK